MQWSHWHLKPLQKGFLAQWDQESVCQPIRVFLAMQKSFWWWTGGQTSKVHVSPGLRQCQRTIFPTALLDYFSCQFIATTSRPLMRNSSTWWKFSSVPSGIVCKYTFSSLEELMPLSSHGRHQLEKHIHTVKLIPASKYLGEYSFYFSQILFYSGSDLEDSVSSNNYSG